MLLFRGEQQAAAASKQSNTNKKKSVKIFTTPSEQAQPNSL